VMTTVHVGGTALHFELESGPRRETGVKVLVCIVLSGLVPTS
jgi:hypothetical protein